MIIMEDLKFLKMLVISLCDCFDFCNSRVVEIVLFEYSSLEPFGLKAMIQFKVIVMEKFKFENSAILCLLLGKHLP